MKITSLPSLSIFSQVAVIFTLALAGPGACYAADGNCSLVFDALTKAVTVPHHTYTTRVAGATGSDKPITSESIDTGGAIYIKIDGKWTRSLVTSSEMLKQTEENRKNTRNAACHLLRDEMVGGEAASVYAAHSETEDAKTEVQVWIAKSSGLPLREEIDMDTGDSQRKHHYSMRYEYANIKAPI